MMPHFSKHVIFLFIVFFMLSPFLLLSAQSDVVFLKSGKKIMGEIIDKNEKGDIKIDDHGAVVEYFFDEIRGVEDDQAFEISEKFSNKNKMRPEKIIERYLAAVHSKNFENIQEFYTKRMWKEIKPLYLNPQKLREVGFEDLLSYEIYKIDVTEDIAKVSVLYVYAHNRIKEVFTLLKEQDQWKIDSSQIEKNF